jgi:Protein of unknown function (DUF992)
MLAGLAGYQLGGSRVARRGVMYFKPMRQLGFAVLLGGLAMAGFWHLAGAQTISGQLKCHVAGGMSFIVGSSRQVDCIFTPAGGLPPEHYTGRINKIGIDLGWKKGGTLLWGVLSPGLTRGPGSLAGNYVGATAEVAAGVGAGANALVGGNRVVLNPISVTGEVGINLAAGIADLDLNYQGQN